MHIKIKLTTQKKIEANRSYLITIIYTIIWMRKQGLAFRGHDESEDSKNRGNFLELIKFQSKFNHQINDISSKNINYFSPRIQNEIAAIISSELIKSILPSSRAYFSIIVDETMNIARHEQVSICCSKEISMMKF